MTTDTHTLDIAEILDLLPHRYPFLLVDRVLEFEEHKYLRAVKNVSVNEPFFQATSRQTDFPVRIDPGSHGAGHRYPGV